MQTKNSILALNPTLNLTQTVTLPLTLALTQNTKSKLQQTTNDDNFKNKSIWANEHPHFFLYAVLICTLECK